MSWGSSLPLPSSCWRLLCQWQGSRNGPTPVLNLHSLQSHAFWMNCGAQKADTYSFLSSLFLQGHKSEERDEIQRSCHWHPNLPQLNQQDLWLPFNLHLATNRSVQLPTGYSYFNQQFRLDPQHSRENNLASFVLPESRGASKFEVVFLFQILDAALLENTKQLLCSLTNRRSD